MDMIDIKNLSFGYIDTEVFRNLNFAVNKGEIFSILGPNGSGKTTLIKCVNRILKPWEGGVLVEGRDIKEFTEKEIARRISSVPQIHRSIFPFTVLEVVLMGRNPYIDEFSSPSLEDTKIALRVLKEVGVYHLKERPYTEISGGEIQLVLIARALAQEPKVLLLDEPTSHLDFRNQILVLETLRRLSLEKKLTIIMSMHDPNYTMMYSNRVMLLSEGSIVSIGIPTEVITEINLKEVYNINTKIVSVRNKKIIVPQEFLYKEEK